MKNKKIREKFSFLAICLSVTMVVRLSRNCATQILNFISCSDWFWRVIISTEPIRAADEIQYSFFLHTLKVNKIFNVRISKIMTPIECVRSCDQKPYLHNETKGGICIKIELNPQKNISLQHGRCFFVYTFNMAALTSCEHTLFDLYSFVLKYIFPQRISCSCPKILKL